MAWKLLPIKLPPGMFQNGTNYQGAGRWVNGNLVRFHEKILRPIGGWVRALSSSDVTGVCRAGASWKLNDGGRRLAFGSHLGLFGWNGGTLSDITPSGYADGRISTVQGFGYGSAIYGDEEYGTQRTTGTALAATTWSVDLWGDHLVAVASHEGIIYEWAGAGATPAAAVANAPTAGAIFVTSERILMALAAGGDSRRIEWSDSEDNTEWTPATTNQAGDYNVPTNGLLMSGVKLTGGQTIILTTSDAWVQSYLGPPWIYGHEKIGSDCGVVGKLAHVEFDQRLAWMGRNQFWMYDGTVQAIPCEVSDYVFGNLNEDAIEKVHTAHIPRFNEIWWFFPTGSGADEECSDYVIYNYKEGTWVTGLMARSCWIDDNGVWGCPIGVKSSGEVYEHENGWTDDGGTREVYVQSGPVEVAGGARTLWVNQIIPDESSRGEVQLQLYSRLSPNGDVTSHGPYIIGSDYVDTRLQGRSVALRVVEVAQEDWRWGVPRLNAQAGSGR